MTTEFKTISEPKFLTDANRQPPPEDMKAHVYLILDEMIKRINRQIIQFNSWNEDLVKYGALDIKQFITPLHNNIEEQLAKLRQKISAQNFGKSAQPIAALVDFYAFATSKLDQMGKIYQSAFKELESYAEKICNAYKTHDECVGKKFALANKSDELHLCDWRRKKLLGVEHGKETCLPSSDYINYVVNPAKKFNYGALAHEDKSREISDFVQHPTGHVFYR